MRVRTDRYGITHIVNEDAPASLHGRVRAAFLTRVDASNPSWEAKALRLIQAHDLSTDDAVRVVLGGVR